MKGSSANRVETAIAAEEDGKIIFTSDYAELGTPEAVKKALLRLCDNGTIIRLAQGIYYKPKFDNELGLGILLPDVDEIAHAIAARDHSRIVPTGDTALNQLGISTQVPANAVYMTDGSPRRITVGNGRGILFRHTSDLRALSYRSKLLMLIVSAMRAIGKDMLSGEHLQILRKYLNNVPKEDFNEDIKLAPAWVRKELMKA